MRNGYFDNLCIIAGDFNCNDELLNTNTICIAIRDNISELGLCSVASLHNGPLTYTYICKTTGSLLGLTIYIF